jgi:hypothetical protein
MCRSARSRRPRESVRTEIEAKFAVTADILQFAADRNIDLDFDIYGERRAIEHGE